MRFSAIPGLEDTKQSLISSVKSNHIAHAQLFAGQEGSANLSMALAFATYLNCLTPGENDACGTCVSCLKMNKFIHPDLHFVFPVSAVKKISGKDVISRSYLKEWRKFLQEKPFGSLGEWNSFFGGENKQVNISKEESRQIIKNLSLKSFEGKYKIMIIWLPEFMNAASANGILKILEEPPENTIFLLVSNDSERLITTIISRTQRFTIRAFTDDEVVDYLLKKHGTEEKAGRQIAQMVDGNLNLAERLLDEIEDDSHGMFRDWMRHCYTRDFTELVGWADRFQKLNKVSQQSLLQYGLNMLRETLVAHFTEGNLIRLRGEELDFIKNFSKVMQPDKLEKVVRKMNDSYYHLERNANAKILFLDLSLAIAGVIRD